MALTPAVQSMGAASRLTWSWLVGLPRRGGREGKAVAVYLKQLSLGNMALQVSPATSVSEPECAELWCRMAEWGKAE